MRRLAGPIVLLLLAVATADCASAAAFRQQSTFFFTGGYIEASYTRPRARGLGDMFFVPVAGFRRAGYQCIALPELNRVNGRLVRHTGSVCHVLER